MSIYQYLNSKENFRVPEFKEGDMLLAMPFVPDLYFNKSVVVITQCTEEAYIGVMLNRRIQGRAEIKVEDRLWVLPSALFAGGPLGDNIINVLYRHSEDVGDSIQLNKNVYFSIGNLELFRQIHDCTLDVENAYLYIGLCVWSRKQLQQELKEGYWTVIAGQADLIFKVEPELLWDKLATDISLSDDCRNLLPEDPQDN